MPSPAGTEGGGRGRSSTERPSRRSGRGHSPRAAPPDAETLGLMKAERRRGAPPRGHPACPQRAREAGRHASRERRRPIRAARQSPGRGGELDGLGAEKRPPASRPPRRSAGSEGSPASRAPGGPARLGAAGSGGRGVGASCPAGDSARLLGRRLERGAAEGRLSGTSRAARLDGEGVGAARPAGARGGRGPRFPGSLWLPGRGRRSFGGALGLPRGARGRLGAKAAGSAGPPGCLRRGRPRLPAPSAGRADDASSRRSARGIGQAGLERGWVGLGGAGGAPRGRREARLLRYVRPGSARGGLPSAPPPRRLFPRGSAELLRRLPGSPASFARGCRRASSQPDPAASPAGFLGDLPCSTAPLRLPGVSVVGAPRGLHRGAEAERTCGRRCEAPASQCRLSPRNLAVPAVNSRGNGPVGEARGEA